MFFRSDSGSDQRCDFCRPSAAADRQKRSGTKIGRRTPSSLQQRGSSQTDTRRSISASTSAFRTRHPESAPTSLGGKSNCVIFWNFRFFKQIFEHFSFLSNFFEIFIFHITNQLFSTFSSTVCSKSAAGIDRNVTRAI